MALWCLQFEFIQLSRSKCGCVFIAIVWVVNLEAPRVVIFIICCCPITGNHPQILLLPSSLITVIFHALINVFMANKSISSVYWQLNMKKQLLIDQPYHQINPVVYSARLLSKVALKFENHTLRSIIFRIQVHNFFCVMSLWQLFLTPL